MARDRDHQAVTARTRAEAARLRKAWDNYVTKGGALEAIAQCPSIWPPTLDDIETTGCDLLRGHRGEHRHRIVGTSVVVTW